MPENELRRDQDVVRCLFEADCGKFIRNSEFICCDVWLLSVYENDLVAWSSNQMGDSEVICLFWFSLVSGEKKSSFRSKRQVDRTDSIYPTIQLLRRIVRNWWRTNWERNIFQGFKSIEILKRIQKYWRTRQINPEQFQGRIILMSMFNDIIGQRWKLFWMYLQCKRSKWSRKEVPARTFVMSSSWKWRKVVWNVRLQARWEKGPASQSNDWIVRTEWSSRVPRYKCVQPRNFEAKGRRKHYSLHSGLRKHGVNGAHHSLSKSAQCLRRSVELVYRLVWKNAR